MTNTGNNSGNNITGGTIFIGGGGGGGNVNYIPTSSPQQWITVNVPPGQQFTISGIDLAVPVDEKKKKSDGCSCKKCKEFFEYAEPNQEDGTLICWACRHGY